MSSKDKISPAAYNAMSKKDRFHYDYLKGKKIEDLSEEEKHEVIEKAKNHFIFYKKITQEPQISKDCIRYKESITKMKTLMLLKDNILETINTI